MSIVHKLKGFIRYRLWPVHNMYTHKAEQFYFNEYMPHISPFFEKRKSLLDIGCQMGRFTIPAACTGMSITATDIKLLYFKNIQKHLGDKKDIRFRLETLDQTCTALTPNSFDVVLCIELLYNLPHPLQNLRMLASMIKPGGVLITSHRSIGYYVYRFIREKNYEAVNQVIEGRHSDYNAQTADDLIQMYKNAGLRVRSMVPIGMFSGFGNDAFSGIANPEKLNQLNRDFLLGLETNTGLGKIFGNNARYWLVIAEPDS